MRVMVTGGAGYVGSVVAEVLLQGGHEVVVYDNLEKGHRDAVPPAAAFIEGDIHDQAPLREALDGCDAVVHMAARSLVGESVSDPARYYHANVQGGLALLAAMRAASVRRLVFSSTAAVYGEPAKQPIEEDDPLRPSNPYGETKLAFERALAWYAPAYDLRYVSLRYFNAAGATERCGERHDPETHLIPLVLQVAAGRRASLMVYGEDYPTVDGTCVRDYVHVADLARAHVLALEALGDPAAPRGAIYNLGCGGEGYTVLQVVEAARQITGKEIPLQLGARRAGDPAVLLASSARIQRELGWRPLHPDLRAIIASAWAWMQRP